MGDVVELLPRRNFTSPVTAVQSLSQAATGRWLSGWDIDDWGRDDTLARVAERITGLRWATAIGGLEHLPPEGPAVIVVNTRRFHLTQWWVALALSSATGRPARFVGRPDSAPVGALARRLGGLLARPDEVAGALRHGQLLVIGLHGTRGARQAGSCDPLLLGPAVEGKIPVFPAAVAMADSSRAGRIEIAPALAVPRRRRGPLGEVELARRVEEAIGELLEQFGSGRTGTPLDWLPWASGAE